VYGVELGGLGVRLVVCAMFDGSYAIASWLVVVLIAWVSSSYVSCVGRD
jgi:hypothetical protein